MNAVIALLVVLSVVVYLCTLAGLAEALGRRRRGEPRLDRFPRVSILKPLAGHDDDLAENLASFARIDYPNYEVLLGVASRSDPAVAAADRFLLDHPWVDARIVVTDPNATRNPKVAQLVGLERVATGEVVVISDSNVRVGPRYLASLVEELCRGGTGLATTLVAGTGERTAGAAIENLNVGASFAPMIAAASVLAKRTLCVGKSMAMWRSALRVLGGFSRFGNVLGEDHVIGRAFETAGLRVGLVVDPIENRNVDCSLARTMERHSRWAKMRRWVAPAAFVVEPLTSPILVATLAAVVSPSPIAFGVLGGAMLLQVAGAFLAVRLLRGSAPALWTAPLEVLRHYLLFACWLSAWVSRRISWRGHPYVLHRGSFIEPAGPTVVQRLRAAIARA